MLEHCAVVEEFVPGWRVGPIRTECPIHSLSRRKRRSDHTTLGQYSSFVFPLLLLRADRSSVRAEESFFFHRLRSLSDHRKIYLNPQRHNYLSCSTSPSAPPPPPLPLLSHFIDESIWPDCPGSSHTNTGYQHSLSINSTHGPTVPTANLHLHQLELKHAADPTTVRFPFEQNKMLRANTWKHNLLNHLHWVWVSWYK